MDIDSEFEECLKGADTGKKMKVIEPENERHETGKLASEASWKMQGAIINYKDMLYDGAIISLQFASSMLIDIALIKLQGIKPENHHCRIVCISKFFEGAGIGNKYHKIMEMKTSAAYVRGSEQDKLAVEAKRELVVALVGELGKKLEAEWSLDMDFENLLFALVIEGNAVKPPIDLLSRLRNAPKAGLL